MKFYIFLSLCVEFSPLILLFDFFADTNLNQVILNSTDLS